jgi:hypothetical protein
MRMMKMAPWLRAQRGQRLTAAKFRSYYLSSWPEPSQGVAQGRENESQRVEERRPIYLLF